MQRFLTHYISVIFFLCFLPWSMKGQSFEAVVNKCSFNIEVAITEPNCQGQDDGQVQLRINSDDVKARWLNGPRAGQALDQTIVPNLSAGSYQCEFSKNGICKDTILFEVIDPPLLLAEPNNITVCDNGSAVKLMRSITGGRPPYKFDFAATDNNAVASCLNCDADFVSVDRTTNFIVTVKDANGCLRERQVKIEVAPKIELMAQVEDVNCFGEENASITLAPNVLSNVVSYTLVSAGDDPAIVQDVPEFDNLAVGEYTVIAEDENGCTEQQIIQVDQPAVLEIENLQVADVSCPGEKDGGILVTAKGGSSNYEYSLDGVNFSDSRTVRDLPPGDYNLIVKDENGCSTNQNFSVADKPTPTIDFDLQDPSCPEEGDASFIVIIETIEGIYEDYDYSIDGVEFKKDSIFRELPAGSYELTARSESGCTFQKKVEITAPPEPAFAINATTPNCPGDDASFIVIIETIEGLYEDYQYSIDGETYQRSNEFNNLTPGNYNVIAQAASGCSFEQAIVVDTPVVPDMELQLEEPACPGEDNASFIVIIETIEGLYEEYEYSLDGENFQSDNRFSSLAEGEYSAIARSASGCLFEQVIVVPSSGTPQINITQQDVTCPGGDDASFIVIIETIEGLYQYSLDGETYQDNNEFTNLESGDITLYVQNEQGCVFTQMIQLNEPTVPTFEINITSVSCNGNNDGIITINPVGGNAPFKYSLDGENFQMGNTFENLSPGIYTITIEDAKGCRFTQVVNVNTPDLLQVEFTIEDASCGYDNGFIASTVSGGTFPYMYTWNDEQSTAVAKDLVAGSYSVTIEDASGCELINEGLEVHNGDGPTATARTSAISCNGKKDGAIELDVKSDFFPLTYKWSNGERTKDVRELSAGSYSVTLSDSNECDNTYTFGIAEPDVLSVSFSLSQNLGKGFISTSVNGGSDPYRYRWSTGENTDSIANLEEGIYAVTITDDQGCSINDAIEFEIEVLDDVKKFIEIFPNPSKGDLTIDFSLPEAQEVSYELIDELGRIIMEKQAGAITKEKQFIDLTPLASAMYFLRINVGREVIVEKVMVVR